MAPSTSIVATAPLHRVSQQRRTTGGCQVRVAVIGAGLGGLAAASALASQGVQVRVFEKSRGVGGRLATRRLEDGARVNHGAPAIDAPTGSSLAFALDRISTSRIQIQGASPVGAPISEARDPDSGVTVFAKALAAEHELVTSVRIARLRRVRAGYELGDEQGNGHGTYDAVVVNAPAPQAADLLATLPDEDRRTEQLAAVRYAPAIILIGHGAPATPSIWHLDGDVRCVARFASAGTVGGIVAHLSLPLSSSLLDTTSDEELLASAAAGAFGSLPVEQVSWTQVKRWRYAHVVAPAPKGSLEGAGTGLWLCGDAVSGPGMAGIWDGGLRAAGGVVFDLSGRH